MGISHVSLGSSDIARSTAYDAYVHDPDGNGICAVCRASE